MHTVLIDVELGRAVDVDVVHSGILPRSPIGTSALRALHLGYRPHDPIPIPDAIRVAHYHHGIHSSFGMLDGIRAELVDQQLCVSADVGVIHSINLTSFVGSVTAGLELIVVPIKWLLFGGKEKPANWGKAGQVRCRTCWNGIVGLISLR